MGAVLSAIISPFIAGGLQHRFMTGTVAPMIGLITEEFEAKLHGRDGAPAICNFTDQESCYTMTASEARWLSIAQTIPITFNVILLFMTIKMYSAGNESIKLQHPLGIIIVILLHSYSVWLVQSAPTA